MSISISIGSTAQDIENLQKTKDLLSFAASNSNLNQEKYTKEEVKDLIQWYDDILNILYNAGTPEELIPSWQ